MVITINIYVKQLDLKSQMKRLTMLGKCAVKKTLQEDKHNGNGSKDKAKLK